MTFDPVLGFMTYCSSIAIRQIMLLALSYDHRLVDGAYAAQFLALVKRHLETWDAAEYGI